MDKNATMIGNRVNDANKLLLKYAAENNKGCNVVISPVSLVLAMTLAFDGANGKTKEQIKSFLGEQIDEKDFNLVISDLQKTLSTNKNLKSANAVISKIDVKDDYKEIIKQTLEAECISEKTGNIVSTVNNWVKDKTLGMIPQLLDDNSNFDLCLINAIAFIADWATKYEADEIHEDEEFYLPDGTTEHGTFLGSAEEIFLENKYCTGFVKKYKGGAYDFIGLRPKDEEEESLKALVDNLDIKALLDSKKNCEVYVSMPEFTMEFEEEISSFCKDNGITEMFGESADFSNMLSIPANVDQVIQKAYIKVDRNGTKAAATTVVAVLAGCAPQDYEVVELNIPFVYAIVHSETGIPVFTGIVNHIQ